MESKKIKAFLIIITSVVIFGFKYFPSEIAKCGSIILMTYYTIKMQSSFNKGIPRYIVFYTFLVFISCIIGIVFNNQPAVSLFNRSYFYLSLFSFFIPMFFSLSAKSTHDIFLLICKLYCIFYFIQWIIYPNILFSGAELNADITQGTYRVRIAGSICTYYLFFYSLNKTVKNFNIKNLFFLLLSFFPILMMGFRTLIVLTLIGSFGLLYYTIKNKIKFIFGSTVFLSSLIFSVNSIPIVNEKLNEMMERQNSDQSFSNDEYVRIIAFDYYTDCFESRSYQHITGGGVPVETTNNEYSKIFNQGNDSYLYVSDLGLYGLSLYIGIPAVILLIFIVLKSCYYCNNSALLPIRFTLLVELLGSFTTAEIYRNANIILLGILLYIVWKYHIEINNKTTWKLES